MLSFFVTFFLNVPGKKGFFLFVRLFFCLWLVQVYCFVWIPHGFFFFFRWMCSVTRLSPVTSSQVTVRMEKVDGLCSAGAGDVVQQVTVEPQSAMAVYFAVVPLIIGNIPINILAYASHSIHDKIQKELKVVVLSCLKNFHLIFINQMNKVQIYVSSSELVPLVFIYRERVSSSP